MVRVPGTDCFYRSVDLDTAAHYYYSSASTTPIRRRPGESVRTAGLQGGRGDLRMPGFASPRSSRPALPSRLPRGGSRLSSSRARCARASARSPSSPAGYEAAASATRWVVNHGPGRRTRRLPRSSTPSSVPPPPRPLCLRPRTGFPETARSWSTLRRLLVKELLRRSTAVSNGPAPRLAAIIGVSSGGQARCGPSRAHGSLRFLGVQSFFRVGPYGPRIFPLVREAKLDGLRAWVESSTGDIVDPRQGYDAPADTRELIELLKAAGADVQVSSTAGPGSWGRWRSTLDLLLAAFAPPR